MRAAARAAALLLLFARVVHADGEVAAPRDAKADVAALLENGLSAAERELRERDGVRPFALVMTRDGRVSRLTPAVRREMPAADALLKELETALRARAQADELEAAATFADVQVTLPDGAESGALRAAWEHRDGRCANVYVPYTRERHDELHLEPQIVSPRKQATVFQRCRPAGTTPPAGPSRSDATSAR